MPNNISTLRNELYEVLLGLKNGTVEPKFAAEMNNTAGKIVSTLNAELKYADQRKVAPSIAFLTTEDSQ